MAYFDVYQIPDNLNALVEWKATQPAIHLGWHRNQIYHISWDNAIQIFIFQINISDTVLCKQGRKMTQPNVILIYMLLQIKSRVNNMGGPN